MNTTGVQKCGKVKLTGRVVRDGVGVFFKTADNRIWNLQPATADVLRGLEYFEQERKPGQLHGCYFQNTFYVNSISVLP